MHRQWISRQSQVVLLFPCRYTITAVSSTCSYYNYYHWSISCPISSTLRWHSTLTRQRNDNNHNNNITKKDLLTTPKRPSKKSPSPMKKKFYAVAVGRARGIYSTWDQCSQQVTGYPNAQFKGFTTLEESRAYLDSHPNAAPSAGNAALRVAPAPAATTRATYRRPREDARSDEDEHPRHRPQHPPSSSSSSSLPSIIARPLSYTSSSSSSGAHVQEVYVDGACRGNGKGSMAKAGYGGFYGPDDARNFSAPLSHTEAQTNNRAEMRAVIHALRQGLRDGGVSRTVVGSAPSPASQPRMSRLVVHTDSKYVLDGLTKYSKKWVRNNFKLSTGNQPVLNQDLWKELIVLRDEYNNSFARQQPSQTTTYRCENTRNDESEGFEIKHVRGHSNVYGNEMADRLAVQGALMSKDVQP